jgi:hypothetical protein
MNSILPLFYIHQFQAEQVTQLLNYHHPKRPRYRNDKEYIACIFIQMLHRKQNAHTKY